MNLLLYFLEQKYDTMDAGAEPLLPIYIVVLSFTIIVTVMMWRKYNQRKSKSAQYLSITFTIYVLLIGIIFVGYLEMYITGYKKELYRASLAIGYSGIMIANCFLILFGIHVFGREEDMRYGRKYIAISVIIAVLVALPWNYYGVPDARIPDNLRFFRPIASALMMLFSIVTYSKIYIEAKRISKKVEGKWAKIGLDYIAYSQICMIGFFVFTLLDTIYFSLSDINGYTFFIYLAWIMVIFFLAFAYIGLVMPKWFKKRFKE